MGAFCPSLCNIDPSPTIRTAASRSGRFVLPMEIWAVWVLPSDSLRQARQPSVSKKRANHRASSSDIEEYLFSSPTHRALENKKTYSWDLVGRSRTDSGMGFGFDQMISLLKTQPSAWRAKATRQGIPIRSLGLRSGS